MDANNSQKDIKQISEANKEMLLKALTSAKKTRKNVRKNIKDGTLPEIPKEIDNFISKSVA